MSGCLAAEQRRRRSGLTEHRIGSQKSEVGNMFLDVSDENRTPSHAVILSEAKNLECSRLVTRPENN